MSRYRKKPVVIDAFRWHHDNWPSWFERALRVGERPVTIGDNGECFIGTLEGEMQANPGDWIIRGVKGELYPCKPDIFEATYEPADA